MPNKILLLRIQADWNMKATIYSSRTPSRYLSTCESSQSFPRIMERVHTYGKSLAVYVFSPRDDLISCLNKAMGFLTAIASSRFPSTNNQLRTSLNLRNQATIKDGRVIVQQVQGRQGQSYSGNRLKESRVPDGQAIQTIIPNNDAFSTKDLVLMILTEMITLMPMRRKKMIDSRMDDMIKEKLALKEQVDSLEQNLSKQIKGKEYEETLILEEESRSKMSEKEKDPEAIKQNISYKPIDYEKLNKLFEDFGKHFTPQQELLAEQAFWLCISNPTIESSNIPPVKVEVPSELL
ncbi:hypothetical protein Tco_1006776 [Tanacetum coccineum]|uniref:Uncharacterized protein n=1 Tax=Tanacetum coccineum TaxID=301880 RepID=A0ABQ5FK14_9ASTR